MELNIDLISHLLEKPGGVKYNNEILFGNCKLLINEFGELEIRVGFVKIRATSDSRMIQRFEEKLNLLPEFDPFQVDEINRTVYEGIGLW